MVTFRKRGIIIQDEVKTFCIRCGTLRVFSRQWKEKANGKGTLITHTETVCPDSACQKIVDEKFAEMRERRAVAEERRRNNVIQAKAAKQILKA